MAGEVVDSACPHCADGTLQAVGFEEVTDRPLLGRRTVMVYRCDRCGKERWEALSKHGG